MKELYEIDNLQEIDRHRLVLMRQLQKQERQVRHDYDHIYAKWDRWLSLGSVTSNLIASLMPKVNVFSWGFTLIKKLFKK